MMNYSQIMHFMRMLEFENPDVHTVELFRDYIRDRKKLVIYNELIDFKKVYKDLKHTKEFNKDMRDYLNG